MAAKLITSLRWMRSTVTESAIDTYTETTIYTNLITEAGQAMEIALVEWELRAQGTADMIGSIQGQLCRESQSSMLGLNNEDVVAKLMMRADIVTSGGSYNDHVVRQFFPPGVFYARSAMYLAVKQNVFNQAMILAVRIGYKLVRLPSEALLVLIQD